MASSQGEGAKMALMEHATADILEAGLDEIRRSPAEEGTVRLIVRRPAENKREVLREGTLDCAEGLVGDTWPTRHSASTGEGPHPDRQLTLMNARLAALVAGGDDRWQLAGDQLYVDFDLSEDNVPAGTRLAIGSAVIELTEKPHTGCKKFAGRFGNEALRFVNSPAGRKLRLRGANARIVVAGTVCTGDVIRKITPMAPRPPR